MRRILLHVCCGPCASACVPDVKSFGGDVTLFFANSNIDTREEFEKRLREAEKLAAVDGVPIVALPYDHEEWLREVAAGCEHEPEKGERCARCFRYNMGKAAEYAKAHGFDAFTTTLTVSPHKVTSMVFAAAAAAEEAVTGVKYNPAGSPATPCFLPCDFKAHGGYDRSVKRAAELGLYRQSYCGCEFSKLRWNIHHKRETESTNLDARAGGPRDVFTADYQTAGRGRLDHKWLSPPGANLLMSVVLPVRGLSPDVVSTLPLVVGLAVARGLSPLLAGSVPPDSRGLSPSPTGSVPISSGDCPHCSMGTVPMIKWPNDILIGGKKVAGILCERNGEEVIAGIGVNVKPQVFPKEIQKTAVSLGSLPNFKVSVPNAKGSVPRVRNAILGQLGKWYGIWSEKGFGAVYNEIAALDALRGQTISVRQTDDDASPVVGVCGGIQPDGSLGVGGVKVYAGEAHVDFSRVD